MLLLFWPGVVTFDGVIQYRQALAGRYDDWHPPVMAALWHALLRLGLAGGGPMFALGVGLFWGGLGLHAAALARAGGRRAAAAVLLIGLFPPLLGWMGCVLKDAQMIAALTAATGLVAAARPDEHRLGGRRLGWPARVAVAVLLGYAVLVRANAAFGVVPLALGLVGAHRPRRPATRAALTLAGIAGALLLGAVVNHRLLGAERSHVEGTLPLFDMAGIASIAGLPTLPHLAPGDWAVARAGRCYTPVGWDPLGQPARCGDLADTLVFDRDSALPTLTHDWIGLIAAHPLAYGEHRLRHLAGAWGLQALPPDAALVAPDVSEPNPWRIGANGRGAARVTRAVATALTRTPFAAPAWWLAIVLGALWLLQPTSSGPARDLATALCWSALGMEAGLAAVGIAPDLRYHLWTPLAGGLALAGAATAEVAPGRARRLVMGLAIAAAVIALARALLPVLPG